MRDIATRVFLVVLMRLSRTLRLSGAKRTEQAMVRKSFFWFRFWSFQHPVQFLHPVQSCISPHRHRISAASADQVAIFSPILFSSNICADGKMSRYASCELDGFSMYAAIVSPLWTKACLSFHLCESGLLNSTGKQVKESRPESKHKLVPMGVHGRFTVRICVQPPSFRVNLRLS